MKGQWNAGCANCDWHKAGFASPWDAHKAASEHYAQCAEVKKLRERDRKAKE